MTITGSPKRQTEIDSEDSEDEDSESSEVWGRYIPLFCDSKGNWVFHKFKRFYVYKDDTENWLVSFDNYLSSSCR